MSEPEKLWPEVPKDAEIHGILGVEIFTGPWEGKPILQLKSGDKVIAYITANLAMMIGGAAKGAQLRWEDHHDAT